MVLDKLSWECDLTTERCRSVKTRKRGKGEDAWKKVFDFHSDVTTTNSVYIYIFNKTSHFLSHSTGSVLDYSPDIFLGFSFYYPSVYSWQLLDNRLHWHHQWILQYLQQLASDMGSQWYNWGQEQDQILVIFYGTYISLLMALLNHHSFASHILHRYFLSS